ncbi:MAG TPA: hypothetical protein VFB36_08535 [Nevskiaceae bacterium]|nr:hypothetical protein [Nevskiaceae bacterium]
MDITKLRGWSLALGCALLGSCLGGGGTEDVGGGSAGECASITGGASHVTKNDNAGAGCLGCSVSNEQMAADGDLSTAASVNAPNSFADQGPSIRATAQSGIVFPAGQVAAVLFTPPVAGGLNPPAQAVTIATYLSGTFQESGSSYLEGTESDGLTFKGFVTSKPFDAVEIMVSDTEAALAPWSINEICSDATPPQ